MGQFAAINVGQKLVGSHFDSHDGNTYHLKVVDYFKRNLDLLCGAHGFDQQMEQTVGKYPRHQVFFVGMSLGAVYAQMASLRFSMMRPQVDVSAVTWNAMRWTDSNGSALVERVL